MDYISDNTKMISYSKIRVMFNKALELESPISFTVGEPDFTASENVVEATVTALREGKSKYSENAGIMPLRQALSKYLKKELGMNYDPKTEITVTTGAMSGIFQALKVILNPGDEVIINGPCWTNYIQQVIMCGGKPVSVPVDFENGFSLCPDNIKNAITSRTKAIMINSPCNPTGAVVPAEILAEVAEIAKEHDLLVISDEVYKHILFDDEKHTSISTFPGMRERTLIIDSFSKTFAMTGFRVGYVAGPAEIIANITKLQENTTACVAMPCQYAALAALEGDRSHLDKMVTSYRERRDYLFERINAMPLVKFEKPKGTFYAFVSVKDTGMTSMDFAMKLLEEEQVIVVPGDAFGNYGEGYIRLSFATSMENIKTGMDRMEKFLNRLTK